MNVKVVEFLPGKGECGLDSEANGKHTRWPDITTLYSSLQDHARSIVQVSDPHKVILELRNGISQL